MNKINSKSVELIQNGSGQSDPADCINVKQQTFPFAAFYTFGSSHKPPCLRVMNSSV